MHKDPQVSQLSIETLHISETKNSPKKFLEHFRTFQTRLKKKTRFTYKYKFIYRLHVFQTLKFQLIQF